MMAIKKKIRRKHDKLLEQQWIAALKEKPEKVPDAQDWLSAETWGESSAKEPLPSNEEVVKMMT